MIDFCTQLLTDVFVFFALYSQQLRIDRFMHYYNLPNLFVHGNWQQYLETKDSPSELTQVQQQNLGHLAIVTLSGTNKVKKVL